MNEDLMKTVDEVALKVDSMIGKIIDAEREPRILYKASLHLISAGGKRLRPYLAVKSCEVVGGLEADVLPVAAALELLHSFTLIHDDIMDQDEKRRGVSTVHALWGIPLAISAGDLLFAKVYEAVLCHTNFKRVPQERILRALTIITKATIAICEGQAMDVLFEKRKKISEGDYMKMISGKTSALFKASAQCGGIIGGGTSVQIQHLGNFAHYAGLAFQMVDDALGLIGDERTLGKPVGSDIREGKRTMIMVHALEHSDLEQKKIILSTLGNKRASADEIKRVIEIVSSLGSIDYVMKKAGAYVKKAKGELEVFPKSPAKKSLMSLVDFFVGRRY